MNSSPQSNSESAYAGPLYIRRLGHVAGPYEWKKLRTLVKRGLLSRIHELSRDGQQWDSAAEYTTLFDPNAVNTSVQAEPSQTETESPAAEPAPAPDSQWHYEQNETAMGPVDFATLQGLISTGNLSPAARVWTKGMDDWCPAETIPALSAVVQPGQSGGNTAAQPGAQQSPDQWS